jgi:hypothetical protein
MFEFINATTVKCYANAAGRFSDGDIGDCFEMLIKRFAGVKKWDRVSPAGKPDFQIGSRHYDAKQNGSPIVYGDGIAVQGSSRVVYAPFVSITVVEQTAAYRVIQFHLAETEFFIVDKNAFVKFLLQSEKNLCKDNPTRRQLNIQTVYNYSKNAPHGKKGEYIRDWCYDNEVDTDLKDKILEAIWNA